MFRWGLHPFSKISRPMDCIHRPTTPARIFLRTLRWWSTTRPILSSGVPPRKICYTDGDARRALPTKRASNEQSHPRNGQSHPRKPRTSARLRTSEILRQQAERQAKRTLSRERKQQAGRRAKRTLSRERKQSRSSCRRIPEASRSTRSAKDDPQTQRATMAML